MPSFEEIEHTADCALRVNGADLAQLLEHAAQGLYRVLQPEAAGVPGELTRELKLQADDREGLLVAWLEELSYLAEVHGLVFVRTAVTTRGDTHLTARLWQGRVTRGLRHVKAVTYHNLAISRCDRGLEATVVLDV